MKGGGKTEVKLTPPETTTFKKSSIIRVNHIIIYAHENVAITMLQNAVSKSYRKLNLT